MCLILALPPSISVSTNEHYLICSLLVCLNIASPATPALQLCLRSDSEWCNFCPEKTTPKGELNFQPSLLVPPGPIRDR